MKKTSFLYWILMVSFCVNFAVPSTGKEPEDPKTIRERIQPVDINSGFKMDGYWVWCGSVIKVGSTYHMFAFTLAKRSCFSG